MLCIPTSLMRILCLLPLCCWYAFALFGSDSASFFTDKVPPIPSTTPGIVLAKDLSDEGSGDEGEPRADVFDPNECMDIYRFSCIGRCFLTTTSLQAGVCQCDLACMLYQDCCWDFEIRCLDLNRVLSRPYATADLHAIWAGRKDSKVENENCVSTYFPPMGEKMVYMIDRCEGSSQLEGDVYNPIPVAAFGKHYINRKVAMCQGISEVDNTQWRFSVDCSKTNETGGNFTDYLERRLEKGLEINVTQFEQFGCYLRFHTPGRHLTRPCIPAINQCTNHSSNFSGTGNTGNLCSKYAMPVRIENVRKGISTVFKNPSCLNCSNRSLRDTSMVTCYRYINQKDPDGTSGIAPVPDPPQEDGLLRILGGSYSQDKPSVCPSGAWDKDGDCLSLMCSSGKFSADGSCLPPDSVWYAPDSQMFPRNTSGIWNAVISIGTKQVFNGFDGAAPRSFVNFVTKQFGALNCTLPVLSRIAHNSHLNSVNTFRDHCQFEFDISTNLLFTSMIGMFDYLRLLASVPGYFKSPYDNIEIQISNIQNKSLICPLNHKPKQLNFTDIGPSAFFQRTVDNVTFLAINNQSFYPAAHVAYTATFQTGYQILLVVTVCEEIFLTCPGVFLNRSRVQIEISTAFWTDQGHNYSTETFTVRNDSVFVCAQPTHTEYSSLPFLKLLEYVCVTISLISLTITLITYCKFPSLRNEAGVIIMNIVVALLLAQLLTQLPLSSLQVPPYICQMFGALRHFFWLAVFSWIPALFLRLTVSFYNGYSANNIKGSCYAIVGWGIPILVVFVCLVLTYLPKVSFGYDDTICWMTNGHYQYSILISVAVPIATSVLLSTILLFLVVLKISLMRRETRMAAKTASRRNKCQELLVYMKLAAVCSFFWIFAFLVEFFPDVTALKYLHVASNGLQGLLIFVVFTANRKVLQLCRGSAREISRSKTRSRFATSRGNCDRLEIQSSAKDNNFSKL